MRNVLRVMRNELRIFLASDRSAFIVYGVLILSWSFLFLFNTYDKDDVSIMLWWIFFSVVISGNFATTIFASERMSGALEVILTSGFSRRALLLGKIGFILIISVFMACFCVGLVLTGRQIFIALQPSFYITPFKTYLGLYTAASFMNASFGAYFAIRLSNPRLVSFVAVLLVGALVSLFYGIKAVLPLSSWMLGLVFCVIGIIWLVFALREFCGERVIRPVSSS